MMAHLHTTYRMEICPSHKQKRVEIKNNKIFQHLSFLATTSVHLHSSAEA